MSKSGHVPSLPSEQMPPLPISSAHAAQLAKVSRRTVMRAIERQELQAFRDNRNRWKINPEDFTKWAGAQWAPSEHAHQEMPTLPTSELAVSLARAEAERDALREQIEQIKEDRNHWREMAEQQQKLLNSSFLQRIFGQWNL